MRQLLIPLILATTPMPVMSQSSSDLFQRAVMYERTEGRLDSAIALYRRVTRQAGTDRALAARALLSLGRAYEMLGRADARATYEQLLREYGDQRSAVDEARSRIAALRATNESGASVSTVWRSIEVGPPTSVSKDGKYLAFTDWMTGDLMLRDLSTSRNQRLTSIGEQPWEAGNFAFAPLVSPDGGQVAYAWWVSQPGRQDTSAVLSQQNKALVSPLAGGSLTTVSRGRGSKWELRVSPSRGGPMRVVPLPAVAWIQPYSWTPDGKQLLVGLRHGKDAGPGSILALVDLVDGSVKELRDLGSTYTTGANVSPDGRWIVFDQPRDGRPGSPPDIHVMAIDGTRERIVVNSPAGEWSAEWTANGDGFIFFSDRTGVWSLWHQPVADGVSARPATLLRGDLGRVVSVGLTRDGRFFFHPLRLKDIAVVTLDPASGAVIEQPRIVTTNMVGSHVEHDWSPDGRQLVMVSIRGSYDGMPNVRSLVIVDVATGEQREHVLPIPYFFYPRWSPDGRSILITGSTEKTRRLFLVDPATGALHTLAVAPDIAESRSEWSFDGKSVFYHRADSSGSIVRRLIGRFDLADSSFHKVPTAPGLEWVGDVMQSKNGKLLAYSGAFARNPGREIEVHVLNLQTGEDRRLEKPRPDYFYGLNWTTDSTLIGITSRDSLMALWRLDVGGSPPRKLDFEAFYLNRPRLNPDGRRLAYQTMLGDDRFGEIRVIRNLLPPPRR